MYLLHIIPTTRLNKTYSYTCRQKLQIGQVVKIEVRNKKYLGIILEEIEDHISNQQQSFKEVSEAYPWILHSPFIQFVTKVSEYTMIELGLVFAMCLPSQFLKKDLNYLSQKSETIFPEKVSLSNDQERALTSLKKAATDKKVIVLDGVTGSGKTSVYSQFILEILKSGKKAILLIPEISLAEIISHRLKDLLNIEPILWHSNISAAKKRKIWINLQISGPQLIIGTRSALFLPMNDVGVIIVDEEHDTSFKQQDQGCYNARDMAILRAHTENIPIILSSATPSLESYYHAKTNKYAWVTLDKRYSNAELPHIELVDFQTKPQNIFSKELIKRINLTLSQGEQALLFMNKRGFSNSVYCKICDKVLKCPSCDMPLSFHKHKKLLKCHSCHFEQPLQSCKNCSQNQLSFFGLGVEQVYEEAKACFPLAKICCLSSDISINQQTEEDQLQLIQDIENKKYDIIVSTQILAKGHNFFNLSTVGILNAEKGLMIQDLRSCEKTFQLLTQMSGRAGRHENTKGYVIIQTDDPSHPLFQSLKNYNRNEFYDLELAQRELFEMPPFLRLASVLISGLSEKLVQQTSRKLLACMNNSIEGISIHGPTEAGIYRMNSQFRLRFLIQIQKNKNVQKFIRDWLSNIKIPSGIKIYTDIDPISF
ncbi:MAG: primosomal protein N' [Candidatus Puniceispirillum sp.]|nr:primosomal protein N' [Candidatus Pelagibacter sp.]MBA4283576.1 primosomal protein N' [Candidatus Puniceispirillum sp.]